MSDNTSKPRPSLGQRIHETLIGDRDPVLLLLIAIILLGVNGYGVVSGMNMILPLEPSIGAGIVVCGLLFAFEANYAGRHSKRIKRLGVVMLIPFVVFWMFTRYYFVAAQFRDAGELISFAATPHSDLVTIVYTPKKAVADSLTRRSEEKYAASERERTAGSGTGKTGYGPRAQQLQREGDSLRDQAAEYTAILELQKPYAEIDTATISPEKTYEITLALWRVTPEFTTTEKGEVLLWKCLRLRDGTGSNGVPPVCDEVIPQPTREQFVDETRQNPVLTPTLRLLAWDPVAWAVLLISLFFDGVALAAGTAIVKKDEPEPVADTRSWIERASGWLVGARQARKTIQYASKMPVEHVDIRDPLRIVHVRLTGERHASNFYNLLYRHTHPLSGRFGWRELQQHENESYKDMARWFVDAARANGLLVDTGAEDEDEALYFPEDSYYATTNFFREMSLREVAYRDQLPPMKDGEEPERVMRVLLPEPIKRTPGAPIKLMRPLPAQRSATQTTAPAVAISAVPNTPVVVQASAVEAVRPTVAPVAPVVPTALAASTQAVAAAVQAPRPLVVEARRSTLIPTEDEVATVHDEPELLRQRRAVVSAPVAVERVPVEVEVDDPTPVGLNPVALDRVAAELERVRREMERDLEEPTEPSVIVPVQDVRVPAEEPPPHEHSDEPPTDLIRAPEPDDETGEVPVPSRADPPTPLAPWVPDFAEEKWEDRPTGSTVVTGRPRERGESGLVLRDDALRHGRIVSLTYRTQPPRLMGADLTSPHAPRIRAVLRELAPAVAK